MLAMTARREEEKRHCASGSPLLSPFSVVILNAGEDVFSLRAVIAKHVVLKQSIATVHVFIKYILLINKRREHRKRNMNGVFKNVIIRIIRAAFTT